jgi:hypothetical protein
MRNIFLEIQESQPSVHLLVVLGIAARYILESRFANAQALFEIERGIHDSRKGLFA